LHHHAYHGDGFSNVRKSGRCSTRVAHLLSVKRCRNMQVFQ
jgi:hypothetical protein